MRNDPIKPSTLTGTLRSLTRRLEFLERLVGNGVDVPLPPAGLQNRYVNTATYLPVGSDDWIAGQDINYTNPYDYDIIVTIGIKGLWYFPSAGPVGYVRYRVRSGSETAGPYVEHQARVQSPTGHSGTYFTSVDWTGVFQVKAGQTATFGMSGYTSSGSASYLNFFFTPIMLVGRDAAPG